MTTDPSLPAVRAARPGDHETIIAVLAEAFLHGDLAPWLVAGLADRKRIYPAYFRLCLRRAFAHGHIDVTRDLGAVAVWYVYDGRRIPVTPDYDTRLKVITGPYHRRFVALDTAMDTRHPHEDHHYLSFLAVHPDRQGRGYGTALLEHHHARLDTGDSGGKVAYLDATGERNAALYERHGYRPLIPYPVADVTSAPLLRPMVRDPR